MAIVLAAGLLAAAGCGDDDEAGGGGAAPPAETPEAASVPVSLTDFEIDPANPAVEPGTVTFEVSNDGESPHALEIEGGETEVVTDRLDPGGSATLESDLEAGEYEWYCPVANHAELGMTGTLTVGDADADAGGGSSRGGAY